MFEGQTKVGALLDPADTYKGMASPREAVLYIVAAAYTPHRASGFSLRCTHTAI